MRQLTYIVSFFCILHPLFSFSQTDEINISASFAQSISLRVTGGGSLTASISSLQQYKSGICFSYAYFEVASSTNFETTLKGTPLVNASGDEIDSRNLTYWHAVPEERASEHNNRWNFGTPHSSSYEGQIHDHGNAFQSGISYVTTDARTLMKPGPSGNAGDYDDNKFIIAFCLGRHRHLPGIDMPVLLDQNIAPGTYTCTITLEAIPVLF